MRKQLYPNCLNACLVFIILLFAQSGMAQTTRLASAITYSKLTYVYSVTNQQVMELYSKNGGIDDSAEQKKLFTTIVDSFATNSHSYPKLKPGNYIFVSASNNSISSHLSLVNDLNVNINGNYDGLSLTVRHNDGSVVKNARITLGRHILLYDSAQQTYHLYHCREQGLLYVEAGGLISAYNLDKYYYFHTHANLVLRKLVLKPYYFISWPVRKLIHVVEGRHLRKHYNKWGSNYKGYIAFNKPEYLPGDTVKVKCYVVTKKGRPVSRPLFLFVSKGYGHEIFNKKITPVSKGNYQYQFVLGDSLQIDETYTASLNDNNGKEILSNTFYLKDYQLKESTYEIGLPHDEYHSGEPVVCNVVSHDANGLPVFDGKLELTLLQQDIINAYPPQVYIPDTLFTHTYTLSSSGQMNITIPDSVFPEVRLRVTVNAHFSNSNGETHDTTLSFLVDKKKQYGRLQLMGSFISATLQGVNGPVPSTGVLTEYTNYGLHILSKTTIKLPASVPINPLAEGYSLKSGTDSVDLDVKDSSSEITANGRRTIDSAFLNLRNTRKLPVTYAVYRNNGEIKSGLTNEVLHFAVEDKTNATYKILFNYTWAGEPQQEVKAAMLYDKNLTVNINQPVKVTPGENVPVSIHVADAKGKGVAGVDVTAMSTNAQFDKDNIPDVPYLGKLKFGKYITDRYQSLRKKDTVIYFSLRNYWFKRMHLDTQLYYRFTNPAKTLTCLYDSTGLNNAQVASYVFLNGEQQQVYYIKMDNEPVYFSAYYAGARYSFVAAPGFHRLYMRTYNRSYVLDSVLLRKGYKLDISINAKLPDKETRLAVTDIEQPFFTESECRDLNNNLLMVNNTTPQTPFYIWNEQDSTYFVQVGKSDGLFFFGPFKPFTALNFAIMDGIQRKFTFEPGYYYDFSNDYYKLVRLDTKDYLKKKLYVSSLLPSLGELAYTKKDIVLKTPPGTPNIFIDNLSDSTSPGNGTLRYNGPADTTIYAILLTRINDTLNQWILSPFNMFDITDLAPGNYRLTFVNKKGYSFKQDSLLVKPHQTLWVNITAEPFVKMDTSTALYKKLFKPAYSYHYLSGYSMGTAAIKGQVINGKTKQPVANALVVADAEFRTPIMMAHTDSAGNYSFEHLKAGTYSFEVFYNGYRDLPDSHILVDGKQTTLHDIYVSGKNILSIDKIFAGSAYTYSWAAGDAAYDSARGAGEVLYAAPIKRGNGDNLGISGGTYSVSTLEEASVNRLNYKSGSALSAMLVQADAAPDGLNINGSRGYSKEYVVNGVAMGGTSPYDFNAFRGGTWKDLGKFKDTLRSRFSDYAYWQPNLLTDKNGNASFTAHFPDNNTAWNSYVLAMDGHKHSGSAFTRTNAVKPLIASLEVPRFLITGDRSSVIGKLLNYTQQPEALHTHFIVNGKLSGGGDTTVSTVVIQRFAIEANTPDSVKAEFGLKLKDNSFADGEKRGIPVMPAGIELSSGMFRILNNDTSFVYTPNNGYGQTTVYASAEPLQALLNVIDDLKNYAYNCNEQLSSKLIACLMEKRIDSAMHKPFKSEGLVQQIIHRLKENEHSNGAWGWWKDSPDNYWMTAYVLHALALAKLDGHYNEGYKAQQFLTEQLARMNRENLLVCLNVLSGLKANIDYDNLLKKVPYDSVSFNEQLVIEKVRAENNLSFSPKTILAKRKETVYHTYYWQEEKKSWFSNNAKTTMLAYNVLKHDTGSKSILPAIRDYLLTSNNGNGWGNTYTTAGVLEVLVPDMLKNFSSTVSTQLTLNDERITSFPAKRVLANDKEIHINKVGQSPVYLGISQRYWNSNPGMDSNLFFIKTYFTNSSGPLTELKQGAPTTLEAQIEVKKQADYVMVQIPIPAGCSYADNTAVTLPQESHREYFKDRVVIFCENLTPGTYRFKINLEPRFSGKYTLNPAKAELMYFPVLKGNNQLKTVGIK